MDCRYSTGEICSPSLRLSLSALLLSFFYAFLQFLGSVVGAADLMRQRHER